MEKENSKDYFTRLKKKYIQAETTTKKNASDFKLPFPSHAALHKTFYLCVCCLIGYTSSFSACGTDMRLPHSVWNFWREEAPLKDSQAANEVMQHISK